MIDVNTAALWYQEADAVHDFEHVKRVHTLALKIADSEKADQEIVDAAVWLHDSQGSAPDDAGARLGHHQTSAVFAGAVLADMGWTVDRIEAVQHCIRAHRFRSTEEPQTNEAKVVFDADKLDAVGAVGAARAVAYSTLAGEPFYSRPSLHFLETGRKEAGEPHSSYHEFVFKLSKIGDRLYTSTAKEYCRRRVDSMNAFFEQLAAEYQGKA